MTQRGSSFKPMHLQIKPLYHKKTAKANENMPNATKAPCEIDAIHPSDLDGLDGFVDGIDILANVIFTLPPEVLGVAVTTTVEVLVFILEDIIIDIIAVEESSPPPLVLFKALLPVTFTARPGVLMQAGPPMLLFAPGTKLTIAHDKGQSASRVFLPANTTIQGSYLIHHLPSVLLGYLHDTDIPHPGIRHAQVGNTKVTHALLRQLGKQVCPVERAVPA